jgi:hypothetical protein
MREFTQAAQAAFFFWLIFLKKDLVWLLLPLKMKWRAGSFFSQTIAMID